MADPVQTFQDFSRNLFVPLIEANAIRNITGFGTPTETDDWVRVDKSETFELGFNPQTVTKAYIDTKNDETSIGSYQTSMEQEIIIDGNNPLYALMYEFSMAFPTGSEAKIPCALIMPSVRKSGEADAFIWRETMLAPGTINTIDKKLTFTMNLNGEMTRGIGTKDDTTGKFTITDGITGTEPVTPASVFSEKSTAKDSSK